MDRRPLKCARCHRRGTWDELHDGKFPHAAWCSNGKIERGERCVDCGGTKAICTSSSSDHEYGCGACGQRWDPETLLDANEYEVRETP